MSVSAKVENLLSGIVDPHLRIEVARTIQFLKEVYAKGLASDEDIINDLQEVVLNVLLMKDPITPLPELKKKAQEIAMDLFATIRAETTFWRVFAKHSRKTMRGPVI